MASCSETSNAPELPELGHGLFTLHLLRGIAGEADRDGDGRVGLAELAEYVSAAVVRDARERGYEQKPWCSMTMQGGEYISRPKKRAADRSAIAPGLYERLPFPIAFHVHRCRTREASRSPESGLRYLASAFGASLRYLC